MSFSPRFASIPAGASPSISEAFSPSNFSPHTRFADTSRIEIHGGRHTGDQGEITGTGDVSAFLQEVSQYTGIKIENRTNSPSPSLEWSKRWYDLPSTPSEKRFKLDPQIVLKRITEQTGMTFTEETQAIRVLIVKSPQPTGE